MPHTFRKAERLHSRTTITQLFEQGSGWGKYPFRVVWMLLTELKGAPVEVMMSVSKKKFKRANKRNLLRRRMKEAWRLNNSPLKLFLEENHLRVACAIIYLPSEELTYSDIEKGMKKNMERLMDEIKAALSPTGV
ncbi:ribonuclease P protein component [Breznakibacter xylanolyticus]|uniref:Ribonuclease P protein component n=1 Tax=Breznakibacter xylanolyticus TaxID=990 RepID=A0A2W7NSD1_9BACT|nr:ribonuclease P protein component [Breznakibacter xylanolyticus]MBN2742740.1 ribonuclease P protein component [Marinilabiliaceae bacterium]PZX19534.1 ribonuclease P protein component [Breznakibacter xylanolyticus]